MIVGETTLPGSTAHPFGRDFRVGQAVELADRARLRAVRAYMAGNGTDQIFRALVYGQDGDLVAQSAERTVRAADPAGWVEFLVPDGPILLPGTYPVDLHSGWAGNGASWYGHDGAGASWFIADLYTDGPSDTHGAVSADTVLWLLALDVEPQAIAEPPTAATLAIEELVSRLSTAGIAATRDAAGFNPAPVGVLVSLPTLLRRTLSGATFEVPILVVSGDPVDTGDDVDRIYATADAIAQLLGSPAYAPTTWSGSGRSTPLFAIAIAAVVTVSIKED